MPRKTSYGPFVRIVAPGRHVYRTTMTFIRWAGMILCFAAAGGTGLCATDNFASRETAIFGAGFAVLFALLTLALVAIGIMFVAFGTKLVVTRERVRVRKWGYLVERRSDRSWSIGDVVGAEITAVPTFHVGGMTPIYGVALATADGEEIHLGASFDDGPSAERMIGDVAESLRRAREEPESF